MIRKRPCLGKGKTDGLNSMRLLCLLRLEVCGVYVVEKIVARVELEEVLRQQQRGLDASQYFVPTIL
jgi:hypothetical protein